MLLGQVWPVMLAMTALMEAQWQVQVSRPTLSFGSYRPCFLQIFVDQMVDTGWISEINILFTA
jgi:hypothetical protein